jgi:hypothetical protein
VELGLGVTVWWLLNVPAQFCRVAGVSVDRNGELDTNTQQSLKRLRLPSV